MNTTDLQQHQQLIIIAARATTATLSLLGSVFIIGWMVLSGEIRNMATRLIFFLSLMFVIEAFSNILTIPVWNGLGQNKELCYTQGIMMQFTQIAEFAWITVIAINLYLNVSFKMQTENFEKIYHICVWIFTCTCTTIPFIIDDAYGFNGLWCWLTDTQGKIFWWTVFYGPLICIWVVVIVLYVLIYRAAQQNAKALNLGQDQKNYTRAILRHSRAYPVIFIIFYTIPLINRFHDTISPDNNIFALVLLQVLTAPLLGFANAVAFCFSRVDQSAYKSAYKYVPTHESYQSVCSSNEQFLPMKVN